jgi:hypothetical protein
MLCACTQAQMTSNQQRTIRRTAANAACGLMLLMAGSKAAAEPLAVLESNEIPLQVVTQTLNAAAGAEPQFLEFQFGFSSAEVPAPSLFLDAVTFSLEGTTSGLLAAVVTADASDSKWAPAITGGLTLDPSQIQRTQISFPDLTPEHPYQIAYSVRAFIPEELRGEPLKFHMDLFSNANGVGSLAWVNQAVVVPEPATGLILLVGVIFYFGFKWRAR